MKGRGREGRGEEGGEGGTSSFALEEKKSAIHALSAI